jgi:hypothetical protein
LGRFIYQVVKHERGWAYRLEQTYSRVFPTQADAIEAAKDAARKMHEPGDQTVVNVEDRPRRWRTELTISPRQS